ncbi:uncharacterized protein LOC128256959 isoform X1 [Drosophila gunungcola]|uniref:N-acetylmuramoyl-L-alanine amidase n=1 Tax=Drosophila gunungcola TaxID=103775 RepID=A0A9Q0BJX0_9MUSC|nr:uncharacterized protein LOC128256959 isoform X1 [Drosophila gunungcola]KAI8034144.1 hypothetical protein M5D96_013106 [Drosophila gunungcola]
MKSKQFLAAAACLGVVLVLGVAMAQENAMLQIPPSLVECYNTSFFMNRDNRLPANMDTLISLIEKVENSYAGTSGVQADIRTVAVSLLHRFRQDGIKKAPGINAVNGVIPYSPTGFQFPKFKILLSRLIPGNANSFPNSSLTSVERCSLHFLLSSTFDTRLRGDENTVCNQLSQYRAQRLPRSLKKDYDNNFIGDVEWLETRSKRGRSSTSESKYGQLGEMDYESDWAYAGPEGPSQCPVEDGLVRTRWGTVSAGTLIAGIAAGVQQQTVQLNTLLALASQRGARGRSQFQTSNSIDNRWAATLAGDLAEVSLVQLPGSNSNAASVGATGGWNDTVLPHWYFLSQRTNLEATDAEIRGGLDGLILAKNVANWRTQASSLKLSQLLRMYYSTNGVLSSGINACSRQSQFTNVAPSQEMEDQTSAFAQVLDREMQLRVTLQPSAIAEFAGNATLSLVTYVPQSLNDVSCTATSNLDLTDVITPMTNLYIFLDTSWQYRTIVDYVVYVIQQLNIHPYASTVTMLSAQDGSVIVNTTNYITDVYQQWNVTTHATYTQGFNLPNVLRTIQNLTQSLMNVEKTNSSLSGHSLVALIIPNQQTVNDGDSSYATTEIQYIREQIPDLRFIYYGGGSIQRFSSFVRDPSQDLFSLSLGSTAATSAGPVAKRIIQIPRRVINPRCGSNWYTNSWGTDQTAQYVGPGKVNFYRVSANYFFGAGANRYLTIQSQNGGSYTICTSRSYSWPQQNSTTSTTANSIDQSCTPITGNSYSYDLSSACNGYYTITQCPDLYLSVQATSNTTSCTQDACQTPDQWRYIMSMVNMGCYSGVSGLAGSLMTILFALLLQRLIQ